MGLTMDLTPLWKSLAIAAVGWLSIGSILITMVLLSTQRGLVKATMYVVGNLCGYAVIGAVALAVGDAVQGGPTIDTVGGVTLLCFAALLLIIAARNLRTVLSGRDREPLRMLASIDQMQAKKALFFGVLVAVINVKNLAIFLTALGEMAALPAGYRPLALIPVVVVFCAAQGSIIAVRLLFGARAEAWLVALRSGLERYGRRVSIVLLLGFAGLFCKRGLDMLIG